MPPLVFVFLSSVCAVVSSIVVCPASKTLILSENKYPPGTEFEIACPSSFIGRALTKCTIRGHWDPPQPFRSCLSDSSSDSIGDRLYTYDALHAGRTPRKTRLWSSRWCSWPKLSPDYPEGTNISLTCPFGYDIGDHANHTLPRTKSTCSGTGNWDGTVEGCSAANRARANACTLPRTPFNGRIYSRSPKLRGNQKGHIQFAPGSFVRYECREGYVLRGPEKITCLEDGYWSTDPPYCDNFSSVG